MKERKTEKYFNNIEVTVGETDWRKPMFDNKTRAKKRRVNQRLEY